MLQLVAAEGAPSFGGHGLSMEMAQLGVPTTLIPDAAIFAMMARVNKVCTNCSARVCRGESVDVTWLGLVAPEGHKAASGRVC
jgi:translation initiation factor eIF-2B subunit beta